ncbi:hypothetical protein [Candidatus Avelusimicrobium luingense]|uniref:hypothetical protein n=1 Tax=Candidatus Avelusimicrobium luingense TaxID=3416211 RepID=UPI003D0E0DFE
MKKFLCALAVLSLLVCGYAWKRTVQEGRFNISGTVTVPERLVDMAQADNNACAIIVKNEADVPVAIKRVVDPKFPLAFTLGEEDLLAETVDGNLKLEVQINNHGQLGFIKQGDIFGASVTPVTPHSKDVVVQADKTMGRVQLARNAKGNFFRTAAR